jgi:NAD+ diphosphatase
MRHRCERCAAVVAVQACASRRSNFMSPRPDLGPKPRLGYTLSRIDRAAERRADAAAMAALESDAQARAYAIGGEMVVLRKNGTGLDPLFALHEARALGTGETVFLGLADGAPRFAVALESAVVEGLKARADLEIIDLRSIAMRALVEAEHLPPLAEGKALLHWHARHRFCSNCGSPTQIFEGGWRRDCGTCKVTHFPRTDPVAIMLAVRGDQCLLGRSHRFQSGMWSCLAGFIEPGEAIEDAVRREIREEAGIVCGRVEYFASQPWPFPTSLMIGCHAQALSRDIVIDPGELADARWFSREEAALMLVRAHPEGFTSPVPVAIAYHIIRSWVEDGDGVFG